MGAAFSPHLEDTMRQQVSSFSSSYTFSTHFAVIFPVSWLRADTAGVSAGLEHPIISHSLQFDVLWIFVIVSIYYKTTTTTKKLL